MKAEIKKITPAMAKQFLASQIKNRKWRREIIDRYKAEMLADNWRINGQPIIFDEDDRLMDGQHRLMALIESNKTINMMTVTGINHEARETIDIGKTRTMGDIFQMSGIRNARLISRTSKLLYVWTHKFNELVQKRMFSKEIMNISSQQIFEFYLENKEDIDHVCLEFKKNTEIITGFSAAVLAFTFAILEKISPDKCYIFITSLMSGRIKKEWSYMIRVREAILSRNKKIRLTEGERISILFGVWNVIYNNASELEVEEIYLNIPNELLRK